MASNYASCSDFKMRRGLMSSEVLFLKDKSVRVVEVGCLFLNLGGFQQDNGDWRMLLHDIIPTPEKWFSKQYMYLVGWTVERLLMRKYAFQGYAKIIMRSLLFLWVSLSLKQLPPEF